MGYGNFQATKLSTDIGAADVSIKLDVLPKDKTGAVITAGRLVIDARKADKREIIKYTGVDLGTVSVTGVTRGAGGITAKPHTKGALVEMNPTAEDWEEALGVPNDIVTRFDEMLPNHVVSGFSLSVVSGLAVAITGGTVLINGIRVVAAAIASTALPASKDVYVDVNTAGVISFNPVNNNAAAPALSGTGYRLGRIQTAAASITNIRQIGYDSLGNRIYNTVAVTPGSLHFTGTGIPSLPPTTDANTISCRLPKPFDIMTVGGKQPVIYQPLLRLSGNGVASHYRVAYMMRPGAAYVAVEPNSGTTVGDTPNYQNNTYSNNYTDQQYWANYDFLPYGHGTVLRVDMNRDGAAGADVNPGPTEMESCYFYYNRDYTKINVS